MYVFLNTDSCQLFSKTYISSVVSTESQDTRVISLNVSAKSRSTHMAYCLQGPHTYYAVERVEIIETTCKLFSPKARIKICLHKFISKLRFFSIVVVLEIFKCDSNFQRDTNERIEKSVRNTNRSITAKLWRERGNNRRQSRFQRRNDSCQKQLEHDTCVATRCRGRLKGAHATRISRVQTESVLISSPVEPPLIYATCVPQGLAASARRTKPNFVDDSVGM